MNNKPRVRATDEDLGELHKTYVTHLLKRVKGEPDDLELTPAEHAAIRNLLKDNGIEVEADIPNKDARALEVELELLESEVEPLDFKVG